MAEHVPMSQTAKAAVTPFDWPVVPRRTLTISGAEARLPDHIAEFQQVLRRFAVEVMRPIGTELDRLKPEEVIAPGSKFFQYHRKYGELGIDLETLNSLEPVERALMFSIVFEELGYGDAGLAISSGAAMLPQYISALFGNQFLVERFPLSMLGCWAITEPDHGSDSLDTTQSIAHSQGSYGQPGCVATIGKDEIIINGQKSAWVSNGPVAEVCILYCTADTGDGPDPKRGCVLVLPLDLDGISRGKPLDKLGQRALPQGEIFFDNVVVPREYMLAGPNDYHRAVYCIHTSANSLMGSTFTGFAHAAFDMALDYAHDRHQGGVPIIRHQSVLSRLFHMYRKVEISRALTRRVLTFNETEDLPALQSGMAAKITCTQNAFEVSSEALQIFGSNGMTRQYPMEKLLRDARASLIEDGCNEILAIKGGTYLMDYDRLKLGA
jgi:alkylation response protein AidB-like acyl-CoA dehydrogenase